jgi:hypothetical protein
MSYSVDTDFLLLHVLVSEMLCDTSKLLTFWDLSIHILILYLRIHYYGFESQKYSHQNVSKCCVGQISI